MLNRHILTVFILATCLAPNLPADDHPQRITPAEWRPDVSAAIEWLEQDLQEAKAQQGFNRLSRRIADLKDAQLFAVYIRLYEHLGLDAREKLCREQAKWLLARTKYAEDHIESHGGSLAPWEANKAEIEFTEKRLEDLNKRLSAYEHN